MVARAGTPREIHAWRWGKESLKIPRPGLGMTNPSSATFDRYRVPIKAANLRFVIPSLGRGIFSGSILRDALGDARLFL
jgi:hypothetical protein